MKRLFAAIKVTPDQNLLKVYHEMKSHLSHERINWVPEQNIHITLKFFGETSEDQIDAICNVLDECAGRHKPFKLHLQDVGVFGSSYDPRVIWFGMKQSEAMEALAIDVLNSVEEIGFARDRQNFRPHLTVGRIKNLKDKRSFQQTLQKHKTTFLQQVAVEEFYLIESRLKPKGPEYEIVKTFRL